MHYNGFEDTDFIILLLYVDDMLVVGSQQRLNPRVEGTVG